MKEAVYMYVDEAGNLCGGTKPSDGASGYAPPHGIWATALMWLAHVPTCRTCAERNVSAEGWRDGNTAPEAPGWYERLFTDGLFRMHWDGQHWRHRESGQPHWRQVGDYPCWREVPTP